jgi:hypothetical protein
MFWEYSFAGLGFKGQKYKNGAKNKGEKAVRYEV